MTTPGSNSNSTSESSVWSGARERENGSPHLSSAPEFPVLAHILPQRRSLPRYHSRDDPWWKKLLPGYRTPQHQNSGMYTIISMSDERLQPRRTWLWISLSSLFVSVLIAVVFVLVPRGVTVGEMTFEPHNWHRKSDHGTYTLQLGVHMKVMNANYYPAKVYGNVTVLFLHVEAGHHTLEGMTVDARTSGQELHFCMDASGVPIKYGLTIIQICMLYPRMLMFVFKANLTVTTWLAEYKLPQIDTYFMVDCYQQDPTLSMIGQGIPEGEGADSRGDHQPLCGELPTSPDWNLPAVEGVIDPRLALEDVD